MPITEADRNNRFKHHAPASDSKKPPLYERIRETMREAADVVVANTPECREQSIAVTKLEEAMFWANAAIARNEEKR